jgi:hypothetical protein
VITDAGVRKLLASLPEDHTRTEAFRTLRYVDSTKYENTPRRHRRFPSQQVFGEWSINTETGTGNAVIYRQHEEHGNPNEFDFRRCILHEVGHAVHETMPSKDQLEWAKQHAELEIIMNEQSRAADEHFCYQYAAYVLRPATVEAGFPTLYAFLRGRVFGGKEYQ